MKHKSGFVFQKLFGLLLLGLSVLYFLGYVGEGDITPVFLLAPMGLYLLFTKTTVWF